MAEVLATMVVGPLVSMVKEKASSYLLEQYNVMEGMEEQHEVLKRKLPAILDVIADAEMQAAEHREGAKAWLEAIRKVAYKANDVFDEFKYEALRRKAKKEGHYRKLGMHVIKLFPTHNRIVFRYRMGNRLRMILQATEVLVAEMNVFRFKFRPQQQLSMKWRQTDSNIIDPMEIAGRSRNQDKKKVVDTLLGQGSRVDLTVLPIVGMGGLGKTTLAQLVYDDSKIQEHFQLLLWVCVSDNFDVDLIAKSIVKAAVKESKNGSVSKEHPTLDNENNNYSVSYEKHPPDSENKNMVNLQEVVSGKRYMLILDDVWNRDASQWEKLKSCLQHGGMGSSVLTTTRDKTIAHLMGTIEAYKLGLLDKSFIEEIIKTKAFGSKDLSPANDERVKMVGDMAKRCAGSPLAATALGSVLCTKPDVKEWKAVLSRSTICDDETGILPILKLSYNDLPSQMRQCFSFCAMFPKDYEIDRDMLIQLWMANGFIVEEKGVCPEIRGKQIFTELASRSFFQDAKEIPSDRSKHGYCSRITCKIHDLMHDVAQSAMGKECAAIATESSKSEDFPYSTRHLFVPLEYPNTVLKGFLERSSADLQTLLCTTEVTNEELKYLSKYNSIRALKIQEDSLFLKPKYLHHLRYIDLSGSSIKALPEDISILYHLQTLNLSGCECLAQLPKGMKYMTALRHLYTDGCSELKMMPPELRCLVALQTLTCFVAGTPGSSCSDVGQLRLLDLGGQLEVRQLENVTETDAQAANLGNKKELTRLELRWSVPNRELPQHHHNKILEHLKPHDGIKALRIHGYGGSTYPTWINTLQHMVELVLYDCNNLEKLPPLWRLPDLQVLSMSGMENLRCLCGGDPPFAFKKLKELSLDRMPNLEIWWDINEVQRQEAIFPEVEKASDGWRSVFPALKEPELSKLTSFQRWEAVEGTVGEQIMIFPCLENLSIQDCTKLTTLPEAPKLSVLKIDGGRQQIFLYAARYITSLSTLHFSIGDSETTLRTEHNLIELVDDKEKWSRESSALRQIHLSRCDFLFPHASAPPALWNCFVQLEDLDIEMCDALVHWPENVFRSLVSLRRLRIGRCEKLTGRTQQPTTTAERSVLPPRLESLYLWGCDSLVEVPTLLPASMRELAIQWCGQLESVVLRGQEKDSSTRLGSGDGVEEKSAVIPGSSTAVPNLSPSIAGLFITLSICSNLQSLSVQLDCTELDIWDCKKLKSLDGDLPSLERLRIWHCDSLESIPDGRHQAYSSLKYICIRGCPRLKVLPPCLEQRLNDIKDTHLDARYTGPKRSRPSIWKYAISKHC